MKKQLYTEADYKLKNTLRRYAGERLSPATRESQQKQNDERNINICYFLAHTVYRTIHKFSDRVIVHLEQLRYIWLCNFNCVKALILHILPHLDDTIFYRVDQMRNLSSEVKLHAFKMFPNFIANCVIAETSWQVA